MQAREEQSIWRAANADRIREQAEFEEQCRSADYFSAVSLSLKRSLDPSIDAFEHDQRVADFAPAAAAIRAVAEFGLWLDPAWYSRLVPSGEPMGDRAQFLFYAVHAAQEWAQNGADPNFAPLTYRQIVRGPETPETSWLPAPGPATTSYHLSHDLGATGHEKIQIIHYDGTFRCTHDEADFLFIPRHLSERTCTTGREVAEWLLDRVEPHEVAAPREALQQLHRRLGMKERFRRTTTLEGVGVA